MRVVDKELLRSFGGPGECEHCGRWVPRRDAAHVFSRGMGGGTRLDVRENLVSLCPRLGAGNGCHGLNHDGKRPTQDDLLRIVAEREGQSVSQIKEYLWALQRKPKEPAAPRPKRPRPARERALATVAARALSRERELVAERDSARAFAVMVVLMFVGVMGGS